MQLGEMQHFNTTPLGEMQPGEMHFAKWSKVEYIDINK